MGADLWYHETSWHEDPAFALSSLQSEFVKSNYEFSILIPEHLESAREAVRLSEVDGDEYGLLDMYLQHVHFLEALMDQPLPDQADAQISILRRLNANLGGEIGNVLDVRGISAERQLHFAQVLDSADIQRFTGHPKPSFSQARDAVSSINVDLGRGECVCFPVYGSGSPVGWMFIGNTVD